MANVYAIVSFIIAASGIKTEKKIFNPITIFCGLWGVIFYLSNLHLYGLNIASSTTYSWFFYGIVAYAFGYYCVRLVMGNKTLVLSRNNLDNRNSIDAYDFNYKIIFIVALFCIPFYLKDFVVITRLAGLGVGLGEIQKIIQGPEQVFVRSSIENALKLLIVNPFVSWMCVPIMSIEFWMGRRNKKLISLLFSLVILRVLTTGGRATVIQLVFCFICAYTFSNKLDGSSFSKELRKKMKKNRSMFILISILLIVLLGVLTYSRAGQAAFRTIYFNYSMQPLMFENWKTIVDKQGITGYGIASLNGLLAIIDYLLRNTIGLALPELYQNIYSLIASTDTNWQWIGPTVRANAYVSSFWFFYLDGKFFGIIVGMTLYGIFGRLKYNKVRQNNGIKNLAIYLVIILGIFYTFGRFQFSQSAYVLALIYMKLFMFRKIK